MHLLCRHSAYSRQGGSGVPVARAMMVDYDNDTESYALGDQFLLGGGLVVAPVVQQASAAPMLCAHVC